MNFLCKYNGENRLIEPLETIVYDKTMGKELYFDHITHVILIRYYRIINGKKVMIKQVVPNGYDLSEIKSAEISEFSTKVVKEYSTFCEREVKFFEDQKNTQLVKKK